MEYQKRINDELLGLQLRKDIIQGTIPTNMLVGGGPLRDFVPSGNSTADIVLEGSVSGDMSGGSKFTKGFKRGFTDALKGTVKTVKKIAKPVSQQVKKDLKEVHKMAVGDLSALASKGYKQGKQALADEAMMVMLGAGKAKPAVGAKPKRVVGGAKPQSSWIQHVKAYQAKHGCSYKDAMKGAKSTYR